MTSHKQVCLAVTLFLFSTFSHSIPLEPVYVEKAFSLSDEDSNANKWTMFQNPSPSDYPVFESSGLIHTPFGTIDPLYSELPVGPWQKTGLNEPYDKRLHIVQSHDSDLQSLEDSLRFLGIDIIDQIPDQISYEDLSKEIEKYKHASTN